MKLVTRYDKLPIKDRTHDWAAYDDDTYDGPGSPMGWGSTEREAEEDLAAQMKAHGNDAARAWAYEVVPESNSVCVVCGSDAVAPLSLCCDAEVVRPSEFPVASRPNPRRD